MERVEKQNFKDNRTFGDQMKSAPIYFLTFILLTILAIIVISVSLKTPSGINATSTSVVFILTPTSTITPQFTVTPLPPLLAKVNQTTFCHNGPNNSYLNAIFISSETQVELLAISDEGNWFMIRQLSLNIDPCWIDASKLTLLSPIDDIHVFTTVLTVNSAPCYLQPKAEEILLQTIIPVNRRIVAYGKSDEDGNWILVVPHDSTRYCWVEMPMLGEFLSENLPIEFADITMQVPTSSSPIFSPTPTRSNGTPTTEPRQCNDGIDNDGDGKTDYPADDGCKNKGDDSE